MPRTIKGTIPFNILKDLLDFETQNTRLPYYYVKPLSYFSSELQDEISSVTRKTRKINETLSEVQNKNQNYKMKQKEALAERER